jgi:cytochrome c553
MRVLIVVFALVCAGAVGCGGGTPTTETPTGGTGTPTATAPAGGPAAKAYGSLAYVMRTIPFPNSNIIFDTQSNDPGAPKKPAAGAPGGSGGATSAYSSVYTGWELVEAAAIALSETANLIMLPGRVCSNGKPVPIDRDDFKKAAQGLADAGMAAYKAAQSKSQDAMVEVSGTVADACAACHEVYRDKGHYGSPERCAVPAQ